MEPQSGYKKKVSGEVSEEKDALTIGKMVGFDDHGLVMMKLFIHKLNKKLGGRKATAEVLEEFQTYLRHFKTGQEETANILNYYSSRKVTYIRTLKDFLPYNPRSLSWSR